MRAAIAAAAVGLAVVVALAPLQSKTKLRLTSATRIFRAPARVRLVARLESTDPRLMCPGVVWDYGDGSRSARKSPCRLGDTDMPIQRSYGTWHTYKACATYRPTIYLLYRQRTVTKASVTVRVLGCLGLGGAV